MRPIASIGCRRVVITQWTDLMQVKIAQLPLGRSEGLRVSMKILLPEGHQVFFHSANSSVTRSKVPQDQLGQDPFGSFLVSFWRLFGSLLVSFSFLLAPFGFLFPPFRGGTDLPPSP